MIFLFYMMFPFVIYLCWTKRRDWFTFVGSIFISLFSSMYYFTNAFVIEEFAARHNFLYCAPWIIGGAIVYLNKKAIKDFIQQFRWLWLVSCICLSLGWYLLPSDDVAILMMKNLVLFLPWLMYAISIDSRILSNKVMKYLSDISLEFYLAQMVIFRVVEKAKCLYIFGNGWISLITSWIVIIVGLIVFIEIWKRITSLANISNAKK